MNPRAGTGTSSRHTGERSLLRLGTRFAPIARVRVVAAASARESSKAPSDACRTSTSLPRTLRKLPHGPTAFVDK